MFRFNAAVPAPPESLSFSSSDAVVHADCESDFHATVAVDALRVVPLGPMHARVFNAGLAIGEPHNENDRSLQFRGTTGELEERGAGQAKPYTVELKKSRGIKLALGHVQEKA